MEHKHHDLHEAAAIADEELDGVSGGIILNTALSFTCPVCQRNAMNADKVVYQGRTMCKYCKATQEGFNVSAAAASARAL